MCEWSFWNFLWILCAAFVAGFAWCGGCKVFGRLLG
jgi:hypothetical protein